MSNSINLSILIPIFPMGMNLFILILLVSFNRTMNRLTKPVSFLVIISILSSALISFLYFINKIEGLFYLSDYLAIFGKTNLVIHLNLLTEKLIIILALIVSTFIGISIYKLPRKKGYVSYMIGIGLVFSTVIFAVLLLDLSNLNLI